MYLIINLNLLVIKCEIVKIQVVETAKRFSPQHLTYENTKQRKIFLAIIVMDCTAMKTMDESVVDLDQEIYPASGYENEDGYFYVYKNCPISKDIRNNIIWEKHIHKLRGNSNLSFQPDFRLKVCRDTIHLL